MNVQSIKDKLKNVAKTNFRLYQELLTVYGLERALLMKDIEHVALNPLDRSGVGKMIWVIRDKQVLLDCDLVIRYGVETKRINEQVKRNIMGKLTKETRKFHFFSNCHNMTIGKCIFALRTLYPAFFLLVGGLE